ncbi:MAG: M81 family metallopeptidase [Limisphaerales bacterium]
MNDKPKVIFAGLFHETHTFLDERTGLDRFTISRGEELLTAMGDSSPMGGALEFARDHDWDIVPTVDYRAVPSGTVTDEVVERWWSDFTQHWHPDADAIFLVLHGAMVSESFLDVEGEILRRIRDLRNGLGRPLFGVYDLHANFTPAMATHANALIAYRTNPHSDAREASVRAAKLLDRCLDTGEVPHILLQPTGLIWPPIATGTADDPMLTLEKRARQFEGSTRALWAINVTAGFAYADTPDTGVSFQTIGNGDINRFLRILRELDAAAKKLEAERVTADLPVDAVIERLGEQVEGLTVLVEPADNIGGGAPGDATGCLRILVEREINKSAIAINDPEAVGALADAEVGSQHTLAVGGKGSLDQGPVELEVELVSRSDGRFELEDKQSHLASLCGDFFEMGNCAVVKHNGIKILLTSNRTPPFDLGQFRSQGIDPAELDVIVVKAAVAHRKAYDPITARTINADTPGPCTSNLSRFNYEHVPVSHDAGDL